MHQILTLSICLSYARLGWHMAHDCLLVWLLAHNWASLSKGPKWGPPIHSHLLFVRRARRASGWAQPQLPAGVMSHLHGLQKAEGQVQPWARQA